MIFEGIFTRDETPEMIRSFPAIDVNMERRFKSTVPEIHQAWESWIESCCFEHFDIRFRDLRIRSVWYIDGRIFIIRYYYPHDGRVDLQGDTGRYRRRGARNAPEETLSWSAPPPPVWYWERPKVS